MADARKDKRTLLSLKIRYKSATLEDFIERYSSDISRGGVFIKAKKPLPVGTLLKFEFMLQDESTLIHGVGRVVWRREEAEADAENPTGMGIKFIKMDAESRAIVQRISDDRVRPGVFDQGKEGAPSRQLIDSDQAGREDRTKVRHVSEFLASALEEGGAGEAARREAQAGAQRARQLGDDKRSATAYGAFAAQQNVPVHQKQSVSETQARGAMSAFGGSAINTAPRISSAAAPAFEELDPEDDFLENETTKIHEYPNESYRPEAAATVVAKDAAAAFSHERRATPVVPADVMANEPLEADVPDLFGPAVTDSFGPGPGEVIDASMFESERSRGRAPVPVAPGIPSEAFKVPQAPEPVWTTRPTPEKQARPGLVILLVVVLVLAGAAVAAWQLGFLDGLIEALSPDAGPTAEPVRAPEAPVLARPTQAQGVSPQAPAAQDTAAAQAAPARAEGEETSKAPAEAKAAEVTPVKAAKAGVVKFEVVSEPPGAFISVNGKRAGRTPVQLEHEVGTKLSVYSKIRGYLGQRQQIEVADGQESLSFELVPLRYVVQVVTSPEGAMASAVGGGVIVTPGELEFKSMPRSRKIVISMKGYKTASTNLMRSSFTEEKSRMFAAVNVTLKKEGAAPSEAMAEPPAAPAPGEVKAEAPAVPSPSEVKAKTEPPAAATPSEAKEAVPERPAEPKRVEEAPAPSETDAPDAP